MLPQLLTALYAAEACRTRARPEQAQALVVARSALVSSRNAKLTDLLTALTGRSELIQATRPQHINPPPIKKQQALDSAGEEYHRARVANCEKQAISRAAAVKHQLTSCNAIHADPSPYPPPPTTTAPRATRPPPSPASLAQRLSTVQPAALCAEKIFTAASLSPISADAGGHTGSLEPQGAAYPIRTTV